jgi:hypothetical protein
MFTGDKVYLHWSTEAYVTAVRHPKHSDQAYSVTLAAKFSLEQAAAVREAAAGQPVSEWLRRAAVAAYSEQAASRD